MYSVNVYTEQYAHLHIHYLHLGVFSGRFQNFQNCFFHVVLRLTRVHERMI